MKLRDHIKSTGTTVDEFAAAHGWPKWGFRKWVYGQRVPSASDIASIEVVTKGEVTLRDWLPASVAEPQAVA